MAVPKSRTSKKKTRQRKANWFAKANIQRERALTLGRSVLSEGEGSFIYNPDEEDDDDDEDDDDEYEDDDEEEEDEDQQAAFFIAPARPSTALVPVSTRDAVMMMAVPKSRTSKKKTRQRKANWFAK